MAKLLKLRRGTTTQHASFTGAEGEVTIDTTKDTAVIHDGSQAGGRPLAREDMSNVSSASIAGRLGTDSIAVDKIAGGTLPSDVKIITANINDSQINNAKIGTNAAIAGTKISPDFGSQAITTTGTTTTSKVTVNSSTPTIEFSESDGNPDYRLLSEGGEFVIQDIQAGPATRFKVNTDGHVDVAGNLDVGAGIDVTGNITATGDLTAGEGNFIKSSNDTTFADASAPGGIHGVFTNNSQNTNGVFSAFTATANNASGTNQGASFIAQSVSGGTCPNVFITQRTASNTQTTGLSIDTSQNVAIPNGNLSVTGNITVSGTVDGIDVAGLQAAKNSLSTSNGALLNGVTATTQGTSDNTTKVATTAYVTTAIGNIESFVTGMIILWSGAANALPTGFVLCNGSNSTPDLRNRFVIGAGDTYAVDATGGSTTISGTVNHSHSTPNHTHGLNGHSHSTPDHTHGLNGHSHSTPNHSHAVNNHTHSISGSVSGNTNNTGGHSHNIAGWNNDSTQSNSRRFRSEDDGTSSYNGGTGNAGNHNHTFSGSFSGNSGNSAPNTTSSGSSNTGANNGNTTSAGSSNTGNNNGNTTSAGSSNTGSSGSGSTVSVLNPYYALCYIMKT